MKIDGEEFFPMGAYLDPSAANLDSLSSAGYNVFLSYWWDVVKRWGNSPMHTTTPSQNAYAIKNYLNNLPAQSYAIIDVDVNWTWEYDCDSNGDWLYRTGFNIHQIESTVYQILSDPNTDRSKILAWYIADEPSSFNEPRALDSLKASCNGATVYWPEWAKDSVRVMEYHGRQHPDSLSTLISRINAIEDSLNLNRLPKFLVEYRLEYFQDYNPMHSDSIFTHLQECVDLPTCSVSGNFDMIDLLGFDSYVFKPHHDNNSYEYSDFNNISRLATAVPLKQMQNNYTQIKSLLFVGMMHDIYDGFRKLSESEITYQFFSPIISGARGLLFFTWDQLQSHPDTRLKFLEIGSFFTSNRFGSIFVDGTRLDSAILTIPQIIDYTIANNPVAFSSPDSYKWRNYSNHGVESNRYFLNFCADTNNHQYPFNGCTNDVHDFKLFNTAFFKYEGDYYLFAVNDFKNKILPSINITFDSNERIMSITRLNPFGADEDFTSFTVSGNVVTLQEMFDSYEVAIFKIKTVDISWSSHSTAILPFNGVNGSDFAVYDFDNNGSMDVLHFSNVVIPSWADSFRVTTYWNLDVNGSNQTVFSNANATNYPSDLYGEFPSNGVSWSTRGGGIGLYEFSCINSPCGVDFFMLTNHTEESTDTFRFKQIFDFSGSPTTAVNSYDVSYNTHPNIGRIDVPGVSGNTVGTGMEVFDLDGSGKPEIILMGIDGDQTSVTQDFSIRIIPEYWAQGLDSATCATAACPSTTRNYTISGISNNSLGGDIAVGDLNGNGEQVMVVASVSMSHRDRIRYRIVGIDSLGEPQYESPIQEVIFSGVSNIQSIGAAIADVNGDGLDDIIFSAITSDSNPPELLCEAEFRDECEMMEGNDITYAHIKVGLSNGGSGSSSKLLLSNADRLPTEDERPTEFLIRNYPNPFNPQTTFQYELPQDGYVRLDVFDMTGRLVSTLVNSNMPSGRHSATFDASRLSSGVYLYRITTGGKELTGKITLLK